MQCTIYRSTRKADTYLYLAREDAFDCVPEALLQALGTPVRVMALELGPERRLAREDVHEVMRCLSERGWFLQLGEPQPGRPAVAPRH